MLDIENIEKRYLLAGLIVFFILVFAVGMKYSSYKNEKELEQQKQIQELVEDDQPKAKPVEEKYIQVYVTGEVKSPRVCKLKEGDRVVDAVAQVELLPEADIKNINMARVLQDGEAVVIPQIGQNTVNNLTAESAGNSISSSSVSSSGMVNINSASAGELDDRLTGIGPTLAQRIVDYRTANGPFASIEDIKNVSGIGEKRFAEIKDMITVR